MVFVVVMAYQMMTVIVLVTLKIIAVYVAVIIPAVVGQTSQQQLKKLIRLL